MLRSLFLMIMLLPAMPGLQAQTGFRDAQLNYPRVRAAYAAHSKAIDARLLKLGIKRSSMQLFIRVLKEEQTLEVWVKNKEQQPFKLYHAYAICASSGGAGPKRERGDGQVPEGVYYIDRFNPASNFHLSLGINFPNQSDRILGKGKDMGGDIFIHGNCVTIGCLPMTDALIEEIYCLAVDAKNNGQQRIPVHIFPGRLDQKKLDALCAKHAGNKKLIRFWEDLHRIYEYFEPDHRLPASITVNANGEYKAEPKRLKSE